MFHVKHVGAPGHPLPAAGRQRGTVGIKKRGTPTWHRPKLPSTSSTFPTLAPPPIRRSSNLRLVSEGPHATSLSATRSFPRQDLLPQITHSTSAAAPPMTRRYFRRRLAQPLPLTSRTAFSASKPTLVLCRSTDDACPPLGDKLVRPLETVDPSTGYRQPSPKRDYYPRRAPA